MPLSRSRPSIEEIDRAVAFVYRARLAGSRRGRLVTLLRSPHQIWMTLRLLARLPVVEVSTPVRRARPVEFYSPFTGSRLARTVERVRCALRLPCVRMGQAVLTLPSSLEQYLCGRQRQAVRTNCARARQRGMVVREMQDEDEGLQVMGQVIFGSNEACAQFLAARARTARRPTKGLRTLAVYDASGQPLGAAAFCRSGSYARLEAIKCVTSELSSAARYLLHTRLVEILIEDGVELLFADSGITVTPGLRYLHQRIGYDVMNVRIRTTPRARHRATARVLPLRSAASQQRARPVEPVRGRTA